MNSELNNKEIISEVENEDIQSEFVEYLEVDIVRKTEDEFIRTIEDENYRIV